MLEQTNEIAIDAELESTPEVSDVTRRITRTVVTSTNYSTSGIVGTLSIDGLANVDDIDFYDASESFNSNVVLSSESQSIAQLDRAQDDLNNFRRRIDANIEEQREHADLMAGLQRKVEEYRRRVAEIENQIGTHKIDERVVFNLIEADSEPWTPDLKSLGTDYEISNRLEEEHRRVDELRLRLEQSRMQIVQLQGENQHLKQQFEITLREKERMYQMRERHLEQYLNEEQKKMMDLWTELQQVRRQCSEYKDQTERDLENQRNEFLKVMRSVGGVARQLNLSAEGGGFHSLLSENSSESGAVINHDTVLVEAMKRFYDQQAAPFKSVDIGLHDELIKKYEEAIERIIELESRGDGNSGKLATFESELKSTREKLIEYQEVLRKVHDLSREAGRHSDIAKRTRSLSPSGTLHAAPSEVLRSVRQVIRARDNELQQLQRRLKVAETEVAEMTARFESAEEARRKFEKQLNDSKKELNIQMKAVENANRDLKRLEERLRTTEAGKSSLESVNKHLNDEIRNFKMMYEQSTAEIERKVLEEADERYHIIEEEHKTRIRELTHRIDGLTDDNKRLKSDLNGVKDKYRNIESEYNNTLLKIEEKDQALKHLEDLRDDLLKDLENQRARFDAVTNELDNLQANFSVSTKNTVAIEMTIKEVKQQRDEISAQKEELSQELVELKHQMEIEFKKRKDMEKVCQCHIGDIEKLQTQVTEYEGQLMILRRHNDDLDTQIKTSHAKISTLENSLASSQKEIGKLTELNMKLQKEKQDLMNMRQKMDNDLDGLKEKLRKTEIEIEKLRNESKISVENEEKIELAYKEEVSRVRLLQKELEEAKFEIENSQRRLKQFEQENKDRLELVLRTKASSSEKSETFESSELIEIRIKELKDRHKLDVEKLENERGELIRRMQLLDDEHAEKERTIEQQLSEIDALKAQHEIEIERLKAEITSLETKYQNELEDERDQYNHNMELAKNTEEELRRKLTTLEKELKDANNNESALQNEGIIWEEKYDTITKELENVREYMGNIRADSEVEIQKWKNDANAAHIEIKNFEVTVETLKAQLMGANERVNSLNKTVSEQAAKIRELSAQIRRLEDELEDAKAIVATHETDLDNALNRLRSIEEQYGILQLENTKLRAEIDSLNRLLDTSKNKNASYEKDVERLKRKLVVLSVTTKEQVSELETRKNEHDQLDKSHRDKSRQIDQLKELIKTFEAKNERLRQELQNTSDKLIVAEADRNSLRNELKKLQQELQFGRDQMLRKTDEFHVALEGLANAHRTSEDGRVNALQELETKKFEISDLESRLENAEQRLATLQQEYINVDKERDVLNDSLRRFQAVITRCASVIPEGGEVVTGPVDVQTIDVHVQKLMNRVEKLEREKNEYRDSLSRLKRKNSDSHVAINKSETFYRSIEERVADVEEERRAAEVKLTSAKQLLRSQEEALKLRDEERHQMRSKIVAFELETRGKEAQLRHLNELVKTLRAELEAAQNDVRRLREREEQWDTNKFQLESKMRDHDGETQRVSMLMATFETERQSLNESLKKLASQLQASESKNADLKDDVDKLKRDLTKAERTEAELRRNLDEQTHLAQAAQHLNEQVVDFEFKLQLSSYAVNVMVIVVFL
uniref:227 kDa spindle-and centromere-associated protein n=1 Tax=Parascaris univalens TaxID=6257 RepID=A0A915AQ06_PARUN